MFERFTDRARRVVVLAQEEARMLNHNYIGTEHILLGSHPRGRGRCRQGARVTGHLLEAVRSQVRRDHRSGPAAPPGHIPFTPRAKKVLELSLREALQLGHNYIGTEHILLGLIREGEGVAAQVLVKLGADLNRVRQQVIQLLSGYSGQEGRRVPAAGRVRRTRHGLVGARPVRSQPDPGRSRRQARPGHRSAREIERVMQILSPPTKNNPVLVGEPGVGKTAVVEGLPRPSSTATFPRPSQDKQLYTLDLGALVAGSRYRGDFRGAPEEGPQRDQHPRRHHPVHRRDPHARGAGAAEGAIDAAAILKPMLARGELQTIGAHHPRRVPQAPREGRRARAPLPAGQVDEPTARAHHRDPQGPARSLRAHHRVTITDGARRGARASPTATSATASCPTRPST